MRKPAQRLTAEELTDKLEQISLSDAGCSRLRKIPGIGPVLPQPSWRPSATALLSKGREFAAWLGVVPRQYSTGGKARLLGINKRGNVYLRKILIHGARAAVGRISEMRYQLERGIGSMPGLTGTSSWLPWLAADFHHDVARLRFSQARKIPFSL